MDYTTGFILCVLGLITLFALLFYLADKASDATEIDWETEFTKVRPKCEECKYKQGCRV